MNHEGTHREGGSAHGQHQGPRHVSEATLPPPAQSRHQVALATGGIDQGLQLRAEEHPARGLRVPEGLQPRVPVSDQPPQRFPVPPSQHRLWGLYREGGAWLVGEDGPLQSFVEHWLHVGAMPGTGTRAQGGGYRPRPASGAHGARPHAECLARAVCGEVGPLLPARAPAEPTQTRPSRAPPPRAGDAPEPPRPRDLLGRGWGPPC